MLEQEKESSWTRCKESRVYFAPC